jgi:hypothetical protein
MEICRPGPVLARPSLNSTSRWPCSARVDQLQRDSPTRLNRRACRLKQSRKSLTYWHRQQGESAETINEVCILT